MIKKATCEDVRVLADMAAELWDSHAAEELEESFAQTITQCNTAFFIRYVRQIPVGFAQCGLRTDYVEGTQSSPAGYLEGIFVKEDYRKQGYAKELLHACEAWAKDNHCREFASDCELGNTDSFRFHMAMGFEEANRIICFYKKL